MLSGFPPCKVDAGEAYEQVQKIKPCICDVSGATRNDRRCVNACSLRFFIFVWMVLFFKGDKLMNNTLDYVHVTLSDGCTREGFLVDVDGDTATVSNGRLNTAFYIPLSTVEVEVSGTSPTRPRIEPVSKQVQHTLDATQRLMEDACQLTYSGPAGTRVLHALTTILARHFLTVEQQQQVEHLLDLHDACIYHHGSVKHQGKKGE